MFEMLLVRHGQTDWNKTGKIMGRRPISLNEKGRSQAKGIAEYLSDVPIDVIYTSPMARALETAEIIASLHRPPVEVRADQALTEIDYGSWVDRTFADIEGEGSEAWRTYRMAPHMVRFPGGESMMDVFARVSALVKKVVDVKGDGRVVFVSHADVVKAAMLNLIGVDAAHLMKFSIDNCAMILVRFYKDVGPRVIVYNQKNGFGRDM
jgi:broad specificity phosphatase PhoE